MQRPKQQKDVQITRDQFKKIQRAIKKPQFMGLMNDYMLQISDPKNRAQYDQYLLQLQKDKELPKGMRLIRPQQQFCVKTTLISNINKRHQMKIFINFCSCIDLDKPSFNHTQHGQNWLLPHSVNKIRYDQDSKGNVCNTSDVAFHPQTMQLCVMQAIQKMVIQAGIDGVSKQLGQRKQSLSMDYVVMKNLKCKGGDPALMPIRFNEGGQALKTGQQNQDQRGKQGKQTKLQRDINKQKQQNKKKKQEQQKQQVPVFDEIQNQPPVQGVQRPKYKVIHSYPVQYQDFIDQRIKKYKYPTCLNIDFDLPRVQSVKQLFFQMNQELIRLQAQDKYFIELKFQDLKIKYGLLMDKAKSKFDKKKKKLRLIIPIDPASLPTPQPLPQILQPKLPSNQQPKPQQNVKSQLNAISQQNVKPQQNVKLQKQQQKDRLFNQQDKLLKEYQTQQSKTNQKDQQFQQQKLWQSKNKLLQINQVTKYQAIVQQQPKKSLPKPLIQQIDQDDHINEPVHQSKPIFIQPKTKIFKNIEYHFQQNNQKVMIIIKLINYLKDLVDCLLSKSLIFFQYKQNGQPIYLCLQSNKQFILQQSRHTYIKDFIIINLIKKEKNQFWQKQSVYKLDFNYQQFKNKREQARQVYKELQEQKARKVAQQQEQKKRLQQKLREQQQGRQLQKIRRLKEVRKKLQEQGSGKSYGAHFIDFNNIDILWQLD